MKLGILLTILSSAAAWKDVHRPIEKGKQKTTIEEQKPWYRTIYSTKVELVTPVVVGGVTFSRQPPATPDPLEPWISLNNEGYPKTIKPELKNGHTKKGHPDYSTYFKVVATKTYTYEDLKAHNMDPNDKFEEEVLLDEDDTYIKLNPIIRCAPNRYFNKGLAKDISGEPFCTPRENSRWKVGKTYFVSWYTHFFVNENSDTIAKKARIHLSYVKESANEKGYHKRDIPATFFSSEWVDNASGAGIYPLEITEDWLQGFYERKIVVSVQPDYIPDEEFDPLEYGVFTYIILGSKVFKETEEIRAREENVIYDREWYYVAFAIPTAVVVALVCIYFFLEINGKYRDFSDVTNRTLASRHRVIGTFSKMKKFKKMKNHKYSELPTYNKDRKES